MKRVLLLLAIILAWFIGCVKEVEQPPIEYKYSVEANNEDFSDKGVNETVSLPFAIEAEYDFTKVPMKYKVESNKEGLFKNGDEDILPNDVYTLEKPELKLSYTGKEAGEHIVKVTFFNDNTKKATVTREVKIKYIEYGYTVEQLIGKNSSYQGEDINFEYRIVPKDESKKEGYTITFKSFDEADNKLEKTKILYEGNQIEFNKSYSIADLSKFKILIKPFYAGTKVLKYVIKNKTGQKEGQIAIEVKPNVLDVTGNLDKTPIGYAGELLNFIGTVKKEPLYVKSLKYKTSIVQGTASGIETNDWKEIVYEGDQIKIPIKILKNGQYQYKISFQDEFGNEIEKILPINSQANYKFKIEVEGGKNPFIQGEEVTFKINLVREEPRLAASYKITFNEVVEGDKGEKATVVTVGGNKISGNTYLVQTDNSDPTNVKYFTVVKVKSFSIGKKKVIFKVFRDAEGTETDNTTGSIDFEVHKSLFEVEQEVLDKDKIVNIGDVVTHTAKVRKSNSTSSIKYRISVTGGDKMGIKDNDVWKDIALENGIVKIPINLQKQGTYKYKMTYKDEFGNEFIGGEKEIRTVEKFEVQFSFAKKRIMETKPVGFNLNINVINSDPNPSVEYYVVFKTPLVTYNNKTYQAGDRIPIANFSFDASLLYKEGDLDKDNKSSAALIPSFVVVNSDGVEKKFYSHNDNRFPNAISPISFKEMYLLYDRYHDCISCGNRNGNVRLRLIEEVDVSLSKDQKIDDFFNTDDIYFKFYLFKKEEGFSLLNENKISLKDIYSSEPDKNFKNILYVIPAVYDCSSSGRYGIEGSCDYKMEHLSKYKPVMNIEVYYKDKLVYKIEDIKDFTGGSSSFDNDRTQIRLWRYNLPKGKVLYENYD